MRILFVIICLLGHACFCVGQSEIGSTKTDIIIKASFIYNFAKHSKWPEADEQSEKFKIAVLGDKDVYEELIDKYSTRTIHFNQTIEVIWLTDSKDLDDVHAVYVSRTKKEFLPVLSELAERSNILLISDFEPISSQVGSISFTVVDNTIAFNVNKIQADKCGIILGNRIIDWANKIIER